MNFRGRRLDRSVCSPWNQVVNTMAVELDSVSSAGLLTPLHGTFSCTLPLQDHRQLCFFILGAFQTPSEMLLPPI